MKHSTIDCPEGTVEALANDRAISAVFLDYDSILEADLSERDLLQLSSALQQRMPAETVHLMVTPEHLPNLESVQSILRIKNFIIRKESASPSIAKLYARTIHNGLTQQYLNLEGFFPAHSIVQTSRFTDTSQKQEAVEKLRETLLSKGMKNRIMMLAANAADELLMNAMFDAPVDKDGKHIYSCLSRNTKMHFDGGHRVEMKAGILGSCLGISVVDSVGSFDSSKTMGHILRSYVDKAYVLDENIAGAGLGLSILLRSGGSLLFASERGVKTEATVFYNLTESYVEFRDQSRFVSIRMPGN